MFDENNINYFPSIKIDNSNPKDKNKKKDNTKEEIKEEKIRVPATEQEEKDFEEYEKELVKQGQLIKSYENLLESKRRNELQEDITKWYNKLGNKVMNLLCQGQEAEDRLGFTVDFYSNVCDMLKSDTNPLLDGDLDKQHEFLNLIASQESEAKPVDEILRELGNKFPQLIH